MAAASVFYQQFPQYNGVDTLGTAKQAALDFASANGYTNDGTNSVVTVNIPPASGPYAGLSSYAEVLVTYNQQRSFGTIFGSAPIPVRARAVARGAWVAPNVGVIVLAYSGKGTLNSQGNGAATESGAPMIVNSNDPSAALDTGNGTLISPEFDITGGYTITNGGQMITNPIPNNIFTGVHPTPDPLAYLPVPSPPPTALVPLQGNKVAPTATNYLDPVTGKTYNNYYLLSPGSYGGAGQPILPNFTNGDLVVFQQASAGNGGIYYLTAGGFNANSADIRMDTGTTGGMMIYNAGTGTNDGIGIAGNANSTVTMSPLTNGPYTGITIFQARNATEAMSVTGNGTFNITGTLYASAALLQIAGNGAVSNIGSQYVSQDLAITGNGNVNIAWAGNLVARTRIITLVE
jgi:hypothetical protein